MKRTVAITGGHLTPAVAVIEELRARGVRVIFFGRLTTMDDDPTPSVEQEIVSRMGVRFIPIAAGRISRHAFVIGLARSLTKMPVGVWQALVGLRQERADLVMSFGGYLAVPVVLAGKLLGIPIMTHEQTMVMGVGNRMIRTFAGQVLVSFPETAKDGALWVGNPVRKSVFHTRPRTKLIQEWLSDAGPFLYITGGNQGAHAINRAVQEALFDLLDTWRIFHQTGDSAQYRDLDRFTDLRESLPPLLKERYLVSRYVFPEDIGAVLSSASVVVSRAGANTIWELALLGKRAVLVPISVSPESEQIRQASWYASFGLGVVLADHPSGAALRQAIETASMLPLPASIPEFVDRYAATRIADRIASRLK